MNVIHTAGCQFNSKLSSTLEKARTAPGWIHFKCKASAPDPSHSPWSVTVRAAATGSTRGNWSARSMISLGLSKLKCTLWEPGFCKWIHHTQKNPMENDWGLQDTLQIPLGNPSCIRCSNCCSWKNFAHYYFESEMFEGPMKHFCPCFFGRILGCSSVPYATSINRWETTLGSCTCSPSSTYLRWGAICANGLYETEASERLINCSNPSIVLCWGLLWLVLLIKGWKNAHRSISNWGYFLELLC